MKVGTKFIYNSILILYFILLFFVIKPYFIEYIDLKDSVQSALILNKTFDEDEKLKGDITDFYSKNFNLTKKVNYILNKMSDEELVGQLLMPS